MIKIFFDASVLFSALYSQTGASYALAYFVREKKIVGITTQTVVEEVVRNSAKLKNTEQEAIYVFIATYNLVVREYITKKELQPFLGSIAQKDAHILAGAINTRCDYIVTLDKKHINTDSAKEAAHPVQIVSPQKMLEIVVS